MNRISFLLFLICLFFVIYSCNKTKEKSRDYPEINNKEKIDSVINSFTQVDYDSIDDWYIELSGYNHYYRNIIRSKQILKIYKKDIEKNLVSDIPISNFLSKGNDYKLLMNNIIPYTYLIIDKWILYKTLELQQFLKKKGYNHKAFFLRDGHRNPTWNEKRGGAKNSRHIYGEAVDIIVGDIDGNANMEKKIIIQILEEVIIKNEGGIGKYPESKVIHYDVRGYRARWDYAK
jgi:hypothetical protein